MSKKKKLSAEEKLFQRRSRAAKKGWRTRRARIKAENEKAEQKSRKANSKNRKLVETSPSPNRRLGKPKKAAQARSKKSEKLRKEAEERKAWKESEVERKAWKDSEEERKAWAEAHTWTVDPVTHNRKGELAKYSSTLRVLENRDSLEERLKKAASRGEAELDQMAELIAEQYDVEVQEVYSFFFSP